VKKRGKYSLDIDVYLKYIKGAFLLLKGITSSKRFISEIMEKPRGGALWSIGRRN
jgi:hypothetical protein